MDKKWCVYIHTNKINGKKYIGITSRKPNVRWGKDGKGYKEGKFRYAIQKYGWNNFEHEIVASNLTKEEADNMEVELIEKFNTRDDKYGYNMAVGGNSSAGFTHTEETKLKCSLAHKGGRSVRARKVICDDIVFDCITDCANYYGMSKETIGSWLRNNTRAQQKFVDMNLRYYGEDINSLIPQIRPSDRRVICDNMEFDTAKDCAEFYGINKTTMTAWLNGNAPMPKKFIDMKLSYTDKTGEAPVQQSNTNVKKEVICEGVIFKSLGECAKHYNVNSGTMRSWLLGYKRMPNKFINLGLKYVGSNTTYEKQKREKQSVVCEGQIFDTILNCAKYYGINPGTMGSWLRGVKRMPQEFYDMGLQYKDKKVNYNVQVRQKKKDSKVIDS